MILWIAKKLCKLSQNQLRMIVIRFSIVALFSLAFEAINSVQLWLDRKIPSFHWSFSPQCIETWKKRPCPLGPLFKRQFKLERLRIFLYEFDLKIAASKCAWFCNTNERETSDRFWSRIRAEKTDWTFELTLFALYQKEFNHREGTMSVPLSNKLRC